MKQQKTDAQKRTELSKKAMLDAMVKSFGNVTQALKLAGIQSRTTYYEWLKEDPEFKNAIDNLEVAEIEADFVESKLRQRINDGDTTAMIFWLKTKGKRRGFVERIEHTGIDGKPIALNIVVADDATKAAIDKL